MKQITIVAPPDEPGIIADIAERLAQRSINILEMDANDDHVHGIVHLRADPYDEALRVLAEAGYHAASEDVLVIRIKDAPGALARVAARFREPRININAMRIVRRDRGWASVLIDTNDNDGARKLLEDCLVP